MPKKKPVTQTYDLARLIKRLVASYKKYGNMQVTIAYPNDEQLSIDTTIVTLIKDD